MHAPLGDPTLDLLEVFDLDVWKSQLAFLIFVACIDCESAFLPLHIRTDPIAMMRTKVELMAIHL